MQSAKTLPRKPLSPRDFRSYLLEAYHNCVNSLRTQNAESVGYEGLTHFQSEPSIALFEGNVGILDSMLVGYGYADDEYKKDRGVISVVYYRKGTTRHCDHYSGGYSYSPEKCGRCEAIPVFEILNAHDLFAKQTSLFKRQSIFSETMVDLGRV